MLLLCGSVLFPQNEVFADENYCVVSTPDNPNPEVKANYKNAVDGYTYLDWSACSFRPNLTPTETITINTTASLAIDGESTISDKVAVSHGNTAYSSHTVSVNVTEAASYNLILSGPAELTGPSTINATTGTTGNNLTGDTWGYAWEDTSIADASANYKALSSNINLTGNDLSNNATSFVKKLVFAAKFQNAKTGTYHADITLSLVVTPASITETIVAVPWDKMVYMQDMTSYACQQASIGDSKTLIDIRERADSTFGNEYTIAKLADGKCWMTQNLRLSRDTVKDLTIYVGGTPEITGYDSNLGTSYPNKYYHFNHDTTGAFSDETNANDFYTNDQIRAAEDKDYGAYYSFNAATVNSANAKSSGSAPYDICPKGWHLPTNGDEGLTFGDLSNKYATPVGLATLNNKRGYWLGGANATAGGAFFVAAGLVYDMGLDDVSTGGYYWGSTAYTNTDGYGLGFHKDGIFPHFNYSRYAGFSIRCIAK